MTKAQGNTFTRWLSKVERACKQISGVTYSDLEDCVSRPSIEDLRAMHDENVPPVAAARSVLTECGF